MKIALVTPYDYPYPGGVTEHVRHLDREFRALGHETRIIAPSSKSIDALAANVIKVNGQVTPFRLNGWIARISLSARIHQDIHEILAGENFDVVHIHEPEVPLLSLLTLTHSQAVTVGTFHAYTETSGLAAYAYPLLMLPVLKRLDGRIFVSKPLRDKVAAYFRGETRVIPNGIDYAFYAAPDVQPIPEFDDGRPNILFVGRMDERKGFRHLGAIGELPHYSLENLTRCSIIHDAWLCQIWKLQIEGFWSIHGQPARSVGPFQAHVFTVPWSRPCLSGKRACGKIAAAYAEWTQRVYLVILRRWKNKTSGYMNILVLQSWMNPLSPARTSPIGQC